MASQQQCSTAKPLAGFFQVTLPILGGRRDFNATNNTTQQSHLSTSYAANENPQQVQNTASDAGTSASQYNEHHTLHAGPLSIENVQDVTSKEDATIGNENISAIPYPPSSAGGDGDDEIESGESEDDDEDTENEEEEDGTGNEEETGCIENDDDDDDDDDEFTEDEEDEASNLDNEDENDEGKEADTKMPLVEEGFPQMDGIDDPEMRRALGKYMKDDCDHIMMCADGKISPIEMIQLMAKDQADLLSGMKRSRWEISDDDEIQAIEDWRAKRTKRGGDAAGECRQSFPWSYGQQNQQDRPSSTGEYHRQGALANTSRRLHNRPVGSAVQRLHTDRFRRPSPKATQTKMPKYPSYPLQDFSVGGEDYIVNLYTQNEEAQPRPSSYRQRQPGIERISSAFNPTADNNVSNTPFDIHNNHQEYYNSHDSFNQSNSTDPARNDAHTASRRAHQHPTASPVHDDPFFSDEMFNGMLNGQPDVRHVGSMYTHAQQRAFDDVYRHLMAPRARVEPETNARDVMPLPRQFEQEEFRTVDVAGLHGRRQVVPGVAATQLHPPYVNRSASAHGGNVLSMGQVASRASQQVEEPDDGLVVGEFKDWDQAWWAFVKSHNSKPLLRGHYPDEYC